MHHLRRVDGRPGDVFVLGSGTIGSQITRYLCRSDLQVVDVVAIPWHESAGRNTSLDDGFSGLSNDGPVDLVWAAGVAGFAASEVDTQSELAAFDDVITTFTRTIERRSVRQTALHVVSSAGGLFEGMHVSEPGTPPRPQRPYGRLKLDQEQHLESLARTMSVHIYRPSSVYTNPWSGNRPGLIGALLKNGIARSPTSIIGAFDTLRDYVHAQDVGRYIAHSVLDTAHRPGLDKHFLVNGEPASIHRVINTVERITRRRMLIQIREAWNAANITFANSVRASGFTPMGITEGTAATLVAIESSNRVP